MSEITYTQFKLRMPIDLHQRLDAVAQESGRSISAEIIRRVEDSFPAEAPTTTALRAMLNDQLQVLYIKRSAGNALTSLDKLKLPKDPAALLDIIDRQAAETDAYAKEERRLRKLFEDAEKLLASRSESTK